MKSSMKTINSQHVVEDLLLMKRWTVPPGPIPSLDAVLIDNNLNYISTNNSDHILCAFDNNKYVDEIFDFYVDENGDTYNDGL